ncbi:unnamed protein product [Brassica rapa]|uniref:Uncharacterized protein n=1 Tax=Brassica campestris TaxID=3711 RepID=A0A8D9D5G0_BRACM|nr:unnamed protein product [Brassica rapa]
MEKLEDLKIMAEQWWNQGIEYLQKIPPTQLYTSIGVLLYTTILLLLYTPLLLNVINSTSCFCQVSQQLRTQAIILDCE